MAADPIIVEALKAKFPTVAELEELRDQVLTAYVARTSVNIHLTSSTGEMGSASGITLATRDEQRDMLACIKTAIAEIEGATDDASARPPVASFAYQRVEL